jgi:phosphohistidine swiveling domain-containing protein
MAILNFNEVPVGTEGLGGKAYNLSLLTQQNFPIPSGIVITELPQDEQRWQQIFTWWEQAGSPAVAVRSSASDEDDEGVSFAGQNSSYLDIKNKESIRESVLKCFESINKFSSKAYREHFLGSDSTGKMNVVIQKMIDPLFAGVYFSVDPRGSFEGDLIEYVEGLGESLVSGQATPYQINNGKAETSHPQWQEEYTQAIKNLGEKVSSYLKMDIDVEWAIDKNGQVHLLQARPITATYAHSNRLRVVEEELARLKQEHKQDTTWDGQTFAEWTGLPSMLTYSLYEEAFSPNMAFGSALEMLGYLSFKNAKLTDHHSVLNRVFGRAYINLDEMMPLYFGDIPYRLDPLPRPHLKFDWKKVNFKSFIRTPVSVSKMIKVGWNLSSKRSYWLDECRKNLATFKDKMSRPTDPTLYELWTDDDILHRFAKECHVFSRHTLVWPFVLITLTESTLSSLTAILKNVLGEKEAQAKLRHWMATGIHTSTFEMNRYFKRACHDEKKRPFFLSRYGHRGPGELDLANPRWIEFSENDLFAAMGSEEHAHDLEDHVEAEIMGLQSFKKTIILQEWKLLKSMLELRELWKMEMLRPFAHIRFLALEVAKRSGLGDDIFYLTFDEIISNKLGVNKVINEIKEKIEKRKLEESIYKLYSFPLIVSLQQIEDVVYGRVADEQTSLDGESLSPGLAYGVVKVVKDIKKIDLHSLTGEEIIVAESTDPGWTPLFSKVKGVIVEKGGILSHAAIVAREMEIPAISGIKDCVNKFKDGDKICLDANNGHISYE